MKQSDLNDLIQKYKDKGGKIKKCDDGKAEGVWTATNILTKPPETIKEKKTIKKFKKGDLDHGSF